MPNKNLVIGAIVSHDLNEIRPFVESLRQSSFEGDIVLFVSRLAPTTIDYLRYNHCILLDYPFDETHKLISVNSYRFILFRRFLERNKKVYKHVMLTDTRDVIFQKDPFDFSIDDRLCVFLEDPSKRIGTCPFNAGWILKKYGRSELSRLYNCEISCSGVTMGGISQILSYLAALHDHLMPPVSFVGDDQGGHNYLVYHDLIGPLRAIRNMQGPVLTMGYLPFGRIRWDSSGRILDDNGDIINILHQYDRHPDFYKRAAYFISRSAPSAESIAVQSASR
jgi:hypothetical protein